MTDGHDDSAATDAPDPSRRRFLAGTVAGTVLAAAGGVTPLASAAARTRTANGTRAELEAAERCRQLGARYFRALDVRDLELLESLLAPDAAAEWHSPTYTIRKKGWAELRDFYIEHFTPTRFSLHNGHTPEISVDGDRASGLWYLHDVFITLDEEAVAGANTVLTGSAIYEHEYVRLNGEWRIASLYYRRRLEMVEPLSPEVKITSRPIRDS